MTDYRHIKDGIEAEAKANRRRRVRRRPLPSPMFGDQPYGAKQCSSCRRWFPAKTYKRNDRWLCADCWRKERHR